MGYRNAISLGGAKKYWQTVSRHHHTTGPRLIAPDRVRFHQPLLRAGFYQFRAMDLGQPLHLAPRQGRPLRPLLPSGPHGPALIAPMLSVAPGCTRRPATTCGGPL